MSDPEGRLTHDWLASYLDLTKDLEAKESLHLWTGFILLSAVVRRKLKLVMKHGIIYPNMYVIFVAKSARARKSSAMGFGRKLLEQALPDQRLMGNSMTSQGLIHALNQKVQIIKDDKIQEELQSDVAIFADEVSNLFSFDPKAAKSLTMFFTECYECPDIYTHTTVKDRVIKLFNLYPVLFGATDPRNLNAIPEQAAGGLIGRLIWIIESDRRKNSSGWINDEADALRTELLREYAIHDLIHISKLKGVMHASEKSMKLYDDWYEALSRKDPGDPNADAFYQRCHTTALRIAMLLSISQNDTLLISEKQMMAAITLIERQLPEVRNIVTLTGGSDFEQKRAKLIMFLQSASGGIAFWRAALKHMGMLTADFVALLETLKIDGTIEIPPMKIRGDLTLKLTKNGYGSAESITAAESEKQQTT